MLKLRGKEIYVLFPYVVSTLFFSRDFVDPTTYPKLITQVLLLTLLVLFSLRNSKNQKLLVFMTGAWILMLASYLTKFGVESLSSTLLGYTQRNLGLLSVLVFALSLWIFHEYGISSFLVTLRYVGLSLAVSIILSNLGAGFFLFDQFVQPNPDSLNSNILSPVLAFSLVAWLSARSNERKSIQSLNSRFLKYTSILLLLYASFLLGNLQSLLYFGIVLFALTLLHFKTEITARILLILPLFVSLSYTLSVSALANLLERYGDSSTKERLILVELFWDEVVHNPFYLRAIDSSADLNLSDKYSPGVYAIIDNAHNVWLEVGVNFGLIPMLACFVLFLFLIYHSISKSKLSRITDNKIVFTEEYSVLIFQQLVFVSLFLAILHPVSIWIYGSIIGISLRFWYKDSETRDLHSNPIASRTGTGKKAALTKLAIGNRSGAASLFILIALVTTAGFVSLDAAKKFEFRQVEKALVNNQIEFETGLDRLMEITLELNDRGYLDYSGRRLMDAGRCEAVTIIVEKQEALGFKDLDYRLLSSTRNALCTPTLNWDLPTHAAQ